MPTVHPTRRTPVLIIDCEGRIVVILAGRPNDDDWDESMERLQGVLANASESLDFGGYNSLPAPSRGPAENRRGGYKTVAVGVSYGGGQRVRVWYERNDALSL